MSDTKKNSWTPSLSFRDRRSVEADIAPKTADIASYNPDDRDRASQHCALRRVRDAVDQLQGEKSDRVRRASKDIYAADIASHNPQDLQRASRRQALRQVRGLVNQLQREQIDDEKLARMATYILVGAVIVVLLVFALIVASRSAHAANSQATRESTSSLEPASHGSTQQK